jgi:hypothetical protein
MGAVGVGACPPALSFTHGSGLVCNPLQNRISNIKKNQPNAISIGTSPEKGMTHDEAIETGRPAA